ncbi:hypothetical protein [Saccharopolyspora griseoalba]|uniref:Uncharacterized protein n=1 Tax=Saccharopolyspora griseoalba TaxID=1431848 RepID=A0ABW2LJW9_9PSEU
MQLIDHEDALTVTVPEGARRTLVRMIANCAPRSLDPLVNA